MKLLITGKVKTYEVLCYYVIDIGSLDDESVEYKYCMRILDGYDKGGEEVMRVRSTVKVKTKLFDRILYKYGGISGCIVDGYLNFFKYSGEKWWYVVM